MAPIKAEAPVYLSISEDVVFILDNEGQFFELSKYIYIYIYM